MNRYENVLVDRMVELEQSRLEAVKANDVRQYNDEIRKLADEVFLLLDCIVEFRNPPRAVLDAEQEWGGFVKALEPREKDKGES